MSKNWSDQSSIFIKLVLFWVTRAYKNILKANLLNCVQISDSLKKANKYKKETDVKLN